MKSQETTHGGFGAAGYDDYSINVPRGVNAVFLDAFERDLRSMALHRYPYLDETPLRAQYEMWLGRPVLFGNGATQLIYAAVRALAPRQAVLFEPSFTEYRHALARTKTAVHVWDRLEYLSPYRAAASGADSGSAPSATSGSALSATSGEARCGTSGDAAVDEWLARHSSALISSGTSVDIMILCNPNNPTGCLFTVEQIRRLLAATDAPLLLDESFIDFVPGIDLEQHQRALCTLMDAFPNRLLVLRSVTKSYSIPGVRVGYLFGDANLLARVGREIEPWSLNRFAITALRVVYEQFLSDGEQLRAHQNKLDVTVQREQALRRLAAMSGVDVYDSRANFMLFRTSRSDLNDRLHEHGFHIRSCSDFHGLGGRDYRIALLDTASFPHLLDALAHILGGDMT